MDEIETLIFRTDRIGDFIISCPFIKSYKKKTIKHLLQLFHLNIIIIMLINLILLIKQYP
jgi:ADP-heptose:LPS heptosyltransferase